MNRLLEGLRILVVEDDDDSRELFEYLFRDHGAEPLTARSADEARTILLTRTVDVIVSDLKLPDEDGCALLASLRANPATAHIPAIAVTAQAEDAAILRAAKAGFARHVPKPVHLDELLGSIVSVVQDAGEDAPRSSGPSVRASGDWSARDDVVALIAQANLGGLVARLNRDTPYRFTRLHRFDGAELATLARFDCEASSSSARTAASDETEPSAFYRSLVERSRSTTLVVTDGTRDARFAARPGPGDRLSYCGVPLVRSDGSSFGVLCHAGPRPTLAPERAVAMLERVARLLRPELGAHER